MKMIAWLSGIVGILVAAFGILFGLKGDVIISASGRHHAPSTFVIMGILLLAIGIWASLLVLVYHKAKE